MFVDCERNAKMTKLIRSFARMFSMRSDYSGLEGFERWMDAMYDGVPTTTGISVNERNALRLPAVWSCVNLKANAAAMMPGKLYRRVDSGRDREPVRNHYLYPIIHDQVNPYMPANDWRRLVAAHRDTWGNHYSWIEWGRSNRPVALWPLPPESVRVKRKSTMAAREYYVRNADGSEIQIPDSDMLHIPGLGFDGTLGYSPVAMLRETLGLGLAQQQSSAALHQNGFTSRLVLEYPGVMNQEQMKTFKESFQESNATLKNAHKAIILQNGMVAKPFSINPVDAQFLESMKYNDAKIYQIFGVPPHMVGDTEKSTSFGAGIEQQTIGFATYTMAPIMDSIETWIGLKLLPDQTDYFVEYEMKGLMRADTAARAAWYKTMIEIGAYSPNTVLANENEPPYDGGDVYRRPLNTAFVDKSGNVISFMRAGATADEEEIA